MAVRILEIRILEIQPTQHPHLRITTSQTREVIPMTDHNLPRGSLSRTQQSTSAPAASSTSRPAPTLKPSILRLTELNPLLSHFSQMYSGAQKSLGRARAITRST